VLVNGKGQRNLMQCNFTLNSWRKT
jgi:hypothetical protein